MPKETRTRIAVLGAGPAGLSAAYTAAKAGAIVDVFEQNKSVGGSLRSGRVDPADASSFVYDLGAASMQMKHAKVSSLIHEDLELTDRTLLRPAKTRAVYIMKDGVLEPLPRGPVSLLKSRLLSFRTKARIFLEPFARRLKDEKESRSETVASFFSRRFSPEFVSYIIDPAVAGIYSGNPAKLSMRHTFESIWDIERKKGSVILPMLMMSGGKEEKALRQSVTFTGGMQSLPIALKNKLEEYGGKIHQKSVRSISRRDDGFWQVNRRGKFDAVISALPAHSLSDLNSNIDFVERGIRRIGRKVTYAPVGVACFGFSREQVKHPLDGFGVLVPSKEQRGILGVQFSSEGYPNKSKGKAEQDKVFLTAYVGGMRNSKLVQKSESEILEIARKEVSELLGVTGKPYFTKLQVWKKGIPQYGLEHGAVVQTARRLELRAPGLVLAGNFRNGIGVPDALLSGMTAAERALEYVDRLKSIIAPNGKEWPVGS